MIILVAGPTGSGKSALGVSLAHELDGEVINVDSVQLYKECIVGAATVTKEEMQGIPHHLIGIVSPDEPFDVAKYRLMAISVMQDVIARGKVPIFVGGTALYITALLYGLAELAPADEALRTELEQLSDEDLFAKLESVDPASAALLHLHDRIRVIRAIESTIAAGTPVSELREAHGNREPLLDAIVIAPLWSRSDLYDRIDARTKKMIASGLVKEVQHLESQYGSDAPALRSIGYKETLEHLHRNTDPAELEREISRNTRRFAKRQMTWLRNQPIKQGWTVRPNESDPALVLEGDLSRFPKPGKVKQFAVWDINREELALELKKAVKSNQKGVQMLFVPGAKVV